MKVQILDALVRLTRQARRVEVRDVVVVGIEHVQEVEAHIEPVAAEPERRVDGQSMNPISRCHPRSAGAARNGAGERCRTNRSGCRT